MATEPSQGAEQVRPAALADSDLPVDLADLRRRCMNNEGLMRRLLAKFAARLPELLNQLRGAVDRREFQAGATLSHSLKGSAGNLSARELLRHVTALESACKANNQPQAIECLEHIDRASERCREFIESGESAPAEMPEELLTCSRS
jgi:HPt (histidine-containing phosphotransfer) domain-containing protein